MVVSFTDMADVRKDARNDTTVTKRGTNKLSYECANRLRVVPHARFQQDFFKKT